jgi:urea transport system permease protein
MSRLALITAAIIVVLALLVPVLNLAVPPESPFHIPDYLVPLLGKYLCFAILALALDLAWGYCGILSLGHGAFFALGGYAMGMYLMRQIGSRGVYANPVLPDFMVFLNWKELPWYWHGFDMFWFAMVMVIVFSSLDYCVLLIGWPRGPSGHAGRVCSWHHQRPPETSTKLMVV